MVFGMSHGFGLLYFGVVQAQYRPIWQNVYPGKSGQLEYPQNPPKDEYIGKDGKKFYSYHFLTDKIRAYFHNNKPFGPLCPLEAEFIIWPDIQMHLSAENFIYQLNPKTYGGNYQKAKEDKQKVKDLPIDQLLKKIETEIVWYRQEALLMTQTPEYQEQGRNIIYCPECGSRTQDGGYICQYCQWQSESCD